MDDQNFLASERDGLVRFQDAQREGLIRKVDGVNDAQARMAPTTSRLSLLGLVTHAATWERRWFGVVMAAREAPDKWPEASPEPMDAALFVDETDTVNRWIATCREMTMKSRAIVAAMDLDSPCVHTAYGFKRTSVLSASAFRACARSAGQPKWAAIRSIGMIIDPSVPLTAANIVRGSGPAS